MVRIGRTVFERAAMLDTGPLISLYDPEDERGETIDAVLRAIQKKKYPVFITIVTIAETHKRLLYDVGDIQALRFLNNITSGDVNIIEITDADINDAIDIIDKYQDQKISYADALTMAIMKRIGIIKILSYDRHFWLLNFTLLP